MKITLQLASENDWLEVQILEKNAQSRVFHALTTKAEITKFIREDKTYFCIFEGKKVGIIACHENLGSYYISDFIIAPEYQGKGLGKLLIKALLDEVVDKKPFELVTHPENTSAIITYLKSGFKIKAWKDNYFGDGQPRILLVKEK